MKKQVLFRKCFNRDGKYISGDHGVEYPKVGWVEAPDRNNLPIIGGGLHAMRVGDDWTSFFGDTWQVFVDHEDMITINNDIVKVRRAYVISDVNIAKYKDEFLKNPAWAYYWARCIDHKPSEETHDIACKDPYWGAEYKHWEKANDEKRNNDL